MNYQMYIKSELLILIPVLYLIGIGLKKSKLDDRFIPIALGGISVLLSSVWVLSCGGIDSARDLAAALFTALTQGILLAGASVYANQLYLQANKESSVGTLNESSYEEIAEFPQQDTFNCDDMIVEEENGYELCHENNQTGSGK